MWYCDTNADVYIQMDATRDCYESKPDPDRQILSFLWQVDLDLNLN